MSKKKQVKSVSEGVKRQVQMPKIVTGKPHFRFEMVDRDGKFKFTLDRDDFLHRLVFEKIMEYSCMMWSEIERQTHDGGKSKHHFLENTDKLSKEAKERIKKLKIEDLTDSIFSFALMNKIRIIGIRQGDYFFVLWYDPEHEVYPIKC